MRISPCVEWWCGNGAEKKQLGGGVEGFYVFADLNPTQTDYDSHRSADFGRILPSYPMRPW